MSTCKPLPMPTWAGAIIWSATIARPWIAYDRQGACSKASRIIYTLTSFLCLRCVVVSMFSWRLRNPTSRCTRSVTTSIRCFNESPQSVQLPHHQGVPRAHESQCGAQPLPRRLGTARHVGEYLLSLHGDGLAGLIVESSNTHLGCRRFADCGHSDAQEARLHRSKSSNLHDII